MFKSPNGGATWSPANSGITDTAIQSLALSLGFATDNTAFAGGYWGGVFKSTNRGSSWALWTTGITNELMVHDRQVASIPDRMTIHVLGPTADQACLYLPLVLRNR